MHLSWSSGDTLKIRPTKHHFSRTFERTRLQDGNEKSKKNIKHLNLTTVSHSYQMDQSICVVRVVGRYSLFSFKFQNNNL